MTFFTRHIGLSVIGNSQVLALRVLLSTSFDVPHARHNWRHGGCRVLSLSDGDQDQAVLSLSVMIG